MPSEMYDTIIIGAGMSGLAAGIRLAHFGQRVCILERHSVIGGLSSFYRRGGRNFDVGLHALTNYTPKGARTGPLAKILRQLRFAWDELALSQQIGSAIAFPDVTLRFTNDFEYFMAEVRRHFPMQVDGLRRLVAALSNYDAVDQEQNMISARQVVQAHISDPLLTEMLFCPVLYYGGPTEHDLTFGQFSILFRSIFLEGLARPLAGIRLILTKLVQRFKQLGGELRLRAGVGRLDVQDKSIEKVVLEDGSELTARFVLSSAGWNETMRLCDQEETQADPSVRRLSVFEAIAVLNTSPRQLGHDRTIVFFNDSPKFRYERPSEPVDLRSGTICAPSNFVYEDVVEENMIRVTCLANYDCWAAMSSEAYQLAKLRWFERIVGSAVRFMPDFRSRVIDTETFTPVTIRRFTGHDHGAMYGAAAKRYDGTTHLKNLFICGTDQGLVGIIGTILSGISIANRHLLPRTSPVN